VAEVIVRSLVVVFVSVGIFFLWIGIVGIIRLPDIYSRLHASTKCDILGAGLVFTGLVIHEGFSFNGLKMATITLLILGSSLAIGHAVARAARRTGIEPYTENREELIRLERERSIKEAIEKGEF